jgi:hypothetical protein
VRSAIAAGKTRTSMWIFTETGFISAVRKPEYPDVITVRARDRQSLEALASKANVEIKRSPNGDYPYRVFVGDGPFIEWFLDRGAELQYENFKNRIYQTRGSDFARALGNVWSAMLAVEDEEARTSVFNEAGEEISHTGAEPNRLLNHSQVPENLEEMSEEEQVLWAEQQAERLAQRAIDSEAGEKYWSDEETKG